MRVACVLSEVGCAMLADSPLRGPSGERYMVAPFCSQHWRTCPPVLRRELQVAEQGTARYAMVLALAVFSVGLHSGTLGTGQGMAFVSAFLLKLELGQRDREYGLQLLDRMRRSSARGL